MTFSIAAKEPVFHSALARYARAALTPTARDPALSLLREEAAQVSERLVRGRLTVGSGIARVRAICRRNVDAIEQMAEGAVHPVDDRGAVGASNLERPTLRAGDEHEVVEAMLTELPRKPGASSPAPREDTTT